MGTVKSVPQSPSGSCFVHFVFVPLISTTQGKEKLCRTCVQGWTKEWYLSLEASSSWNVTLRVTTSQHPDSQGHGERLQRMSALFSPALYI